MPRCMFLVVLAELCILAVVTLSNASDLQAVILLGQWMNGLGLGLGV